MLVILIGGRRILCGHHDLMQLFSRPDTGLLDLTSRQHSLRQIRDLKGGNLTDEGLSAVRLLQCLEHQLHTLRQTDPESGHTKICNRQFLYSFFDQLVEEGNDRPAASRHITVSDNGEIDILRPHIGIGRHKQFVRDKLRSAVEIHRIDRLVRGQRHHLAHTRIQRRIDHVHRPVDIGLDRLVWIVLAGGHLL